MNILLKVFSSLTFLCTASLGSAELLTEERALKDTESHLITVYRVLLDEIPQAEREDTRVILEQSQRAWEVYRDVEVILEIGPYPKSDEWTKKKHASVLARLTKERIETLDLALRRFSKVGQQPASKPGVNLPSK